MKLVLLRKPYRKNNGFAELLFLAVCLLSAGGLCSFGQSIVYLSSGLKIECQVIEYNNGAFILEFKDGTRRQVRQENVSRIQFDIKEQEINGLPLVAPVVDGQEATNTPPTNSESVATSKLVLAPYWQSRIRRSNLALADTARLLSKCGTPQIDMDGKPITIWRQITYLMPIQEAKKALGFGISTRETITCAAFPSGSFFYHAFSGNYEDGFNRLYLVTDFSDQVVGIQWQDTGARAKKWFPLYSNNYSQDWSLYNFVSDRRKANPNWLVGFYICKGSKPIFGYPPIEESRVAAPSGVNEGVIRIDSELFSVTKDHWGITTDEKSRERSRLLLAQPIVDLMLFVVQQSNN